jgi:hypothetical protein
MRENEGGKMRNYEEFKEKCVKSQKCSVGGGVVGR